MELTASSELFFLGIFSNFNKSTPLQVLYALAAELWFRSFAHIDNSGARRRIQKSKLLTPQFSIMHIAAGVEINYIPHKGYYGFNLTIVYQIDLRLSAKSLMYLETRRLEIIRRAGHNFAKKGQYLAAF